MNKPETALGSTERKPNAARALILTILMSATPALAAEPTQPPTKTAEKGQAKPSYRWKNVEEAAYAFFNAKTTDEKRRILLGMANQFPLNVLKNQQAIPIELSSEVLLVASKNAAKKDPLGYLEFVSFNKSEMIQEEWVKMAAEKLASIEPARLKVYSALINSFQAWGPELLARAGKAPKEESKVKMVNK